MKKSFEILFVFIIGLLFITQGVHAQMGTMMGLGGQESQGNISDGHTESVEDVLQSILNSQNVTTVQELDLSKISDDEWEQLGDAVMELQHPGEAHEAMDRMMGGEGSDSLRQMHINMGKAYLGSGDTNYGPGMMMGAGMMGSRSFNTNQWQGGSMMGVGTMGYGGFGMGLVGGIIPLLVVIFLLSGTAYFIKQLMSKK